jgi:hypothetical protein
MITRRDPSLVFGHAARDMLAGNIVRGVFTPVLAEHSKAFSLIDCLSGGVDRMQRNFEPMQKQMEALAEIRRYRKSSRL